jgi:hypothetical protein
MALTYSLAAFTLQVHGASRSVRGFSGSVDVSRDTYLYFDPATNLPCYIGLANGDPSPTAPTRWVPISKIVSDATTITSITDLRERTAIPSTYFTWTNPVEIGTSARPVDTIGIGNGLTSVSPLANTTIRGTNASGVANTVGTRLTLSGGQSTGSAIGGGVTISVTPAGAAGTTPNSYVDAIVVSGAGTIATRSLYPLADGVYELGSDNLRWARIRGAVIQAGDLELIASPDRPAAHWRIVEHPDWIEIENVLTGRRYRMAREPLDGR